jgi:hypothetical protein
VPPLAPMICDQPVITAKVPAGTQHSHTQRMDGMSAQCLQQARHLYCYMGRTSTARFSQPGSAAAGAGIPTAWAASDQTHGTYLSHNRLTSRASSSATPCKPSTRNLQHSNIGADQARAGVWPDVNHTHSLEQQAVAVCLQHASQSVV